MPQNTQNQQQQIASPKKKLTATSMLSLGSSDESMTDGGEKPKKPQVTSKFWNVIHKEMVGNVKQKAFPSIKKINNVLNIYKSKLDAADTITDFSSTNPTKQAPRYNMDQGPTEGRQKDKKNLKGKDGDQSSFRAQTEFLDESGVEVFSFKRRMQLEFKQKRDNSFQKKKKDSSKIENPSQLGSGLEDQGNTTFKKIQAKPTLSETPKAEAQTLLSLEPTRSVVRKDSKKLTTKGGGGVMFGVIERLTKASKKDESVNMEGKEFKYAKAKELFAERQKATDFEQFKRDAIKKIKQSKREFYDKIQNSKPIVPESIKFVKDKVSRRNNLMMPDFEKAVKFNEKEKEFIFMLNDLPGNNEDRNAITNDKENMEKLSKIMEGNLHYIWKAYQHHVN